MLLNDCGSHIQSSRYAAMLTDYEAIGHDADSFDLAAQIAGADTFESSLEVNLEKEPPTWRLDKKMRILCLHGMPFQV